MSARPSQSFESMAVEGLTLTGGGGVLMYPDARTLTVVDTDFGVGATENLPSDVSIDEWLQPQVSYGWFQGGASFTCSAVTNTCR